MADSTSLVEVIDGEIEAERESLVDLCARLVKAASVNPPGRTAEVAQVVKTVLEMLELEPFADLTPANVTANWRQRAALARALILKPEVLLLDAPLRGVRGSHVEWWLHFLEQLQRGHEWFGGRPMTILATTEDLRPWQGAGRQFAFLKDKQFVRVGGWRELEASSDPVIKELLAAPAGATI